MNKAQGQTVKTFVDKIFLSHKNPQAIDECRTILRLLGMVLAELHRKTIIAREASLEVLEVSLEKLNKQFDRYLKSYKEQRGQHADKIEENYNNIIANFDTSIFYFTFFHNDAHLENFIYNQSTGITIIDTPKMHHTIDTQGNPLFASYLHDLARAEDDIAKWVMYYEYNEELIDTLIEALESGYKEAAGELFIPSQFAADKAKTLLSRLSSYLNWESEKDPVSKEHKKRIIQYYLFKLKR
jgi:hypothetical protein